MWKHSLALFSSLPLSLALCLTSLQGCQRPDGRPIQWQWGRGRASIDSFWRLLRRVLLEQWWWVSVQNGITWACYNCTFLRPSASAVTPIGKENPEICTWKDPRISKKISSMWFLGHTHLEKCLPGGPFTSSGTLGTRWAGQVRPEPADVVAGYTSWANISTPMKTQMQKEKMREGIRHVLRSNFQELIPERATLGHSFPLPWSCLS